jgi:hypothetical protein
MATNDDLKNLGEVLKAQKNITAEFAKQLGLGKAINEAGSINVKLIAKSTKSQEVHSKLLNNINGSLEKLKEKELSILKRKEQAEDLEKKGLLLKQKLSKFQTKALINSTRVGRDASSLEKRSKRIAKVQEALGERYREINDKILDINQNQGNYNKILSQTQAKYSELLKLHDKYGQDGLFMIDTEKDLNDAIDYRIQKEKELVDLRLKAGDISQEAADAAKHKLSSPEAKKGFAGDIEAGAGGKRSPLMDYALTIRKRKGERAGDIGKVGKEEKMALGKDVLSAMKDLKNGPKGILSFVKAMSEVSAKNKVLNKEMLAMGQSSFKATGMFTMLGTAMKALGAIGWVGLLVSAVQAVAGAVNGADKLIKGLNTSFTQMQGPTVALKDVRKSMREFSNAVFDMDRNLKLGINSEDIMGLFQAMSAGGLSLQGVGKRVSGGYNEVITEAAKLSKDFGVEMSEVGAMISDSLVDLRSSMDDVNKSMQEMSYDATIAGVSSQKFYQATMAASDALSYYGNYLQSSSALIKTFSQTAGMGFKDASKQATDMMGTFANLDSTGRMKFIAIAGVGESVKEFKAELGKAEAKGAAINTEIEDLGKAYAQAEKIGDQAEMQRIRQAKAAKEEELARIENQKRLLKMGTSGDITQMQAALPAISAKLAKLTRESLEKAIGPGVNLFDDSQFFKAQQFLKATGTYTEENATKLIQSYKTAYADTQKIADTTTNALGKLGTGSKKELQNILSGYKETIEKGDQIDYAALEKDLKAYIIAGGDIGTDVNTFMDNFQKNAYAVLGGVDNAVAGVKFNAVQIKDWSQKIIEEPITVSMSKEDRDKRIDKLVKNTMSFDKMIGITKESAAYMAAMASDGMLNDKVQGAIIGTSLAANSILKFLLGGKKQEKTGEALKNDNSYKAILELQKKATFLQINREDTQAKLDAAKNKWEKAKEKFEKEQTQENRKDVYSAFMAKDSLELSVSSLDKQIADLVKQQDDLAKSGNILVGSDQAKVEGSAAAQAEIKNLESMKKEQSELIGKTDAASKKRLAELDKQITAKGSTGTFTDVKQDWWKNLIPGFSSLNAAYNLMGMATQKKIAVPTSGEMSGTPGVAPDLVRDKKAIDWAGRAKAGDLAEKGPLSIPKENDFKALTSGFAKLSAGDLVIDYKSLASGMSAGKGGLAGGLLGGASSMSSGTTVTVPITLHFGSVNGDVDDMLKKLTPAIEQSFTRMFFNSNKKK